MTYVKLLGLCGAFSPCVESQERKLETGRAKQTEKCIKIKQSGLPSKLWYRKHLSGC